MIEIIVIKRENDYHASIKGQPEIWAGGEDYYSAIGNLVASHQDEFEVKKITMVSENEIKKVIKNGLFGTPVSNMNINTNINTTPMRTDRI